MKVVNEVMPTSQERLDQIEQPGPEGPIYMVNLLKFKDRAEYEDGRETNLTGREAYLLYGQVTTGLIRSLGGEVTFDGAVTLLNTGQVEDLWDEIVIARYPKRATLVEMARSEAWLAAEVHRVAGLAGEINIETVDASGDR